jgi:RNA polymerase sigma-70 factor (ECF subfamily)
MAKATHYQLLWNLAGAESVDAGQEWILTAMQRYGPKLVTMLWRILGSEQDVCDAYQDTFVKLAHGQSGQKPEKIKAYLFRTAGNVAINYLRKRRIHERACGELARSQREFSEPSANDMDAEELQEQLRNCITRLPEKLQNVIVLHDLGEMSYLQVGQALGMSIGTARVYRHRAIQYLAKMINRKT